MSEPTPSAPGGSGTSTGEPIHISVIYALAQRQPSVRLQVAAGTSVGDAVARSGLMERFPEIAARPLACAIYGRAVALTHPLRAGDRVEIVRPLQIDPKESRRRAAARAAQTEKDSARRRR